MTIFRFRTTYFIVTVLLFIVEFLIGLYMHDDIVRPYVGDFLVVILMYSFVKSFFDVQPYKVMIGVLIFAYLIEISQYFHLVNLLGLGNSRIACMLMGTYFAWMDLLMYTLGLIPVWLAERFIRSLPTTTQA